MFSIGLGEIIVILFIAVIFLRPNDIPRIAKSFAKWYKELKGFYNSINDIKTKTIEKIENEIIKSDIHNSHKEEKNEKIENIESETHEEERERHLFTDINFYNDKTKILILGSFPVPMYTQEDKFYAMEETERENVWYYESKRSEFWKLIAKTYGVKNKEEFYKFKKEKMELFENNNIGIADVFFACRRKNKTSSDDTTLTNIIYNRSVIEHIRTNKALMRIIFTSKFVEMHFFKMLTESKIEYKLANIKPFALKHIAKKYIQTNRIKHIILGKRKIETVVLSLKRSSVNGLTTNDMKEKMFDYHLKRKNIEK